VAGQKSRRRSDRRGSVARGPWVWVVGAVVVLVALFFLARTLSTAPTEAPPVPVLANAAPDLTALTRMLGDIGVDSTRAADLPEDVRAQLGRVDSLVTERSWYDAIELLRRLRKSTPPDRAAFLHDYLGYCHHQAAHPDRALLEFRRALEAAGPGDSLLRYRIAFCVGYLFQSRGFADSALAFYSYARGAAHPDSTDPLLPALLNNLGLAREYLKDRAGARELYLEAARHIDTSGTTSTGRTLRDNLRRVEGPDSPPAPAAQVPG